MRRAANRVRMEDNVVEIDGPERNVGEAGGIRVGMAVRATLALVAACNARGVSERAENLRRGGVVTQIVTNGVWTNVRVRLDVPTVYADGTGHSHTWESPDGLEPAGIPEIFGSSSSTGLARFAQTLAFPAVARKDGGR